ncbi:MAG: hypothetical protein LBJ70_00390 [Holosporales bacterium]|jgi:hypothetical protein|nr:hypothetical protein [Holosporales bacterium]
MIKMEYFNCIGGLGWYANKYARVASLDDAAVHAQIKIFDNVVLPLSKLLRPITRHIFGQFLVCVLRKTLPES